MKISHIFEYIFRSQHNQSEFAHFVLLIFLLILFFTYVHAVKDQLDEKIAYMKRRRGASNGVNVQPATQAQAQSLPEANTGNNLDKKQQKLTKQQIIEILMSEEYSDEGFKIIKEKQDHATTVKHKEDVENPIFRVDMLVDKISPRQIFEVLRDQGAAQSWFGKNLQSKVQLAGDIGEKVYSTLHKGGVYPLKNREIIHRHILHAEESKHIFAVSFTTQGLESVPSKNKAKYARAYQSLCGIVMRGQAFNEAGEAVASKVFFISQMEFAGQYVPVVDQYKAVPTFMLEFVEKLIDRAHKVKLPL